VPDAHEALTSPVSDAAGDEDRKEPAPGIALCLSGGGYRAMLFHVGALWRLNQLGYLSKLDRVSSVSGGSITAATLAYHWGELAFDDDGVAQEYVRSVVGALRRLARETIDGASIIGGIFTPGVSIGDKVAAAYRKHLFGEATLQTLPDTPRFVINATNLQTGSLWRFSKPYMADFRVGVYPNPDVQVAVAVGASSAFPPVLSPVRLDVDPNGFSPEGRGDLYKPPYSSKLALSDGGVYDNLGLETAWKRYKTILVSDGGGRMAPEPEVHGDWARQSLRVNSVIDNQVRSLRKLQVIAGFQRGDRDGVYWGIRTHIADYTAPNTLPCPPEQTLKLAETKTRLAEMDDDLQERLINWGYAVCDAGMRTHVLDEDRGDAEFPYPNRGVG
jgi:NTE family protein